MNREAIYAAFFERIAALATAGTLTTASRDLAFVEELDPSLFPAVYQNQTGEEPQSMTTAGVECWLFSLDLYVYVLKGAPAAQSLNAVNDAVFALLGTPQEPSQFFVPGVPGVAHAVWPDGGSQTWEGILGNRAVTRIPVRILVPYA
jgi:hypothetical protein